MATTVWRGHISFGLVTIPVRLFRAARSERVNLRELYRLERSAQTFPESSAASLSREGPAVPDVRTEISPEEIMTHVAPVHYARVEDAEGAVIPKESLTKGFEYEKDRFVTIDEREIRALAPKTSTEMEILEFVNWGEIDPVYLETSYYVQAEEAGKQAYALLLESMRQTGLVSARDLVRMRQKLSFRSMRFVPNSMT